MSKEEKREIANERVREREREREKERSLIQREGRKGVRERERGKRGR